MPIRRLLYAVPLALAASLAIMNPILGRLLLPFREVLLSLVFLQLLICAVVIWKDRSTRHPYAWTTIALSILLATIVALREYDVHERTIAFDSNGTRLVGTLYLPQTSGPHPALVLVHGSGKFPRRMYRYWGQAFARLGFNILIYDKRGVGDSGGAYEGDNNTSNQNLMVLAQDAAHAVDVVAALPGATPHIGLFGLSQGGWIAPLAAQLNPKVKFLVLHSGPVVSVREQNLYEHWTGYGRGTMTISDAEQRLAQARAGGFDPRETLSRLNVRALWIFGDNDQLVPVHRSITNLQALIVDGKIFEYRLLPHADHLLLTHATYFSHQVTDQYWSTIVDWMKQNEHRELAYDSLGSPAR